MAAQSTVLADTVWLSSLDIRKAGQGYGKPRADKSVGEQPLSIGGQKFERGFGTHAPGSLYIDLKGGVEKFSASVGIDDEVGKGKGTVEFRVMGDGKVLWKSGTMKGGDPAKKVEVDLRGVKTLLLLVTPAGDGKEFDHADWADAKFEARGVQLETINRPGEEAVILTPKPAPQPRINGAKVFGVRPGAPFLFTIAATGGRPMEFSAEGLPNGLKLDPATGRITGSLGTKGEHLVKLRAKNSLGTAERNLRIFCGEVIALTPPMGWNSWNCFAGAVTDEKVRAAADAMVGSGLINHGWSYINIDDYWQNHRDSKDPTLQGPTRDKNGKIVPNVRFPDMKNLADYIHGLGLKAGLYSSPGPWTCGGCAGSWLHEKQDARTYADWGFDYLKYDWCSYGTIAAGGDPNAKDIPLWGKNAKDTEGAIYPYRVMGRFLREQPRDIVYSLCQYGMGDVWEWGEKIGGNCWRTTGDITDTWVSMSDIGFSQNGHEKFAGPGHWNDPDMLVVGRVGWAANTRPTRLSPNEQYTHISLWCLLASPLLIGCDMTHLDDFTLSLLTNDEVLDVNQDPLGKQAARVSQDEDLEVWARDMEDGSKAVGLFNRGETEATVTARWSDVGVSGKRVVRDLWRQKDVGTFDGEYKATVPAHGVVLVRIQPAK